MLLVPMYHNINSDKYTNDFQTFKDHLVYIKQNYKIVLPGDDLDKKNICLTFDDGFFNFYKYMYPLLQDLNIKALLAVPTKFILEDTDIVDEERLSIKHDDTYANIDKAPFCTWAELKEMQNSGFVQIASHSHNHVNLTESSVDLRIELEASKNILEHKLNTKIDSFVFPYGKYNNQVHTEANKYYKYLFRIGNASNKDFAGINKLIYRINADGMNNKKDIFSLSNMFKYKMKNIIKSIK